jgi:hypothetical protein
MKAKLISPQLVRNPLFKQKCLDEALRTGGFYAQRKYIERPAGWEIENPDVWKLVCMGVAEPADEECEEAVAKRMTDSDLWQARIAQRRVAKGIHPEDYEEFENGEMDGYAPDGSHILGPNAEPL